MGCAYDEGSQCCKSSAIFAPVRSFFRNAHRNPMPLPYLRIFHYIDEIARAGSVRKAAESLFITPSALDRRLQDLEQELDAELFERHARGMRLTAAGELFLHHI